MKLAVKGGRKLIIVIQTAIVFRYAPAVPISQTPVFPPNPRLAKLSIAAIEPIDDVDGGRGADSYARGSGCGLSLVGVWSSPNPSNPKPDRLSAHFHQSIRRVLVSVLVWTVMQPNFPPSFRFTRLRRGKPAFVGSRRARGPFLL